jgi:hypothetical protein
MGVPIFISSSSRHWKPSTEEDIQKAIDEGLLNETHYLDVKRELESGSKANKELARDMASFAIDGGTLLVGINEDKTTGTLTLTPQTLKGLPERIEQIARSVVDQPLEVITEMINSSSAEEGYLLVHIPPSSVAPHMVDNKYIGRGDKTKIYLSDAEVIRLHERRSSSLLDGEKLVRHEFTLDPIPHERRKNAHLFLVAEPVPGRQGMLLDLLGDVNAARGLLRLQEAAYASEVKQVVDVSGISPELIRAYQHIRRSRGAALSSSLVHDSENNAVEMEVHEDGGLRLFMGCLSDTINAQQVIFENAAVIYTRQLIALTLAAAEEAGYFGNWLLGIGATGLKGKCAYQMSHGYISDRAKQPYDSDEYIRTCLVTYAELNQSPGQATERLVGKLLRSLGTYNQYIRALKD